MRNNVNIHHFIITREYKEQNYLLSNVKKSDSNGVELLAQKLVPTIWLKYFKDYCIIENIILDFFKELCDAIVILPPQI